MLQFTDHVRIQRVKELARSECRLGKAERKRAVGTVAEVLAKGEPTLFAFEAACRHRLRAEMCLDGMSWSRADDTAAEIVAKALEKIGARRPAWSEGQREWTTPLTMRTLCAECGTRLPEPDANHPYRKYCSRACNDVAAQRRYKARRGEGEGQSFQPRIQARPCEHCAMTFKPKKQEQRFCCTDCRNNWERDLPKRPCEHCGMAFAPKRTIARFCSSACQWQAWKHNVQMVSAP